MHRHKFFNLFLHDDKELEPLLQGDILERVTLHEWPLSCVQRLTTFDGRKIIYKAQFGPTVEPEFYASAQSELRVSGDTIYQSDGHVSMLIEFVEAPPLTDLDVSENQAVQLGRMVLAKIADISGGLPVYIDASTEDKWGELVDGTLTDLKALVSRGRFGIVDTNLISKMKRWAFSKSTLSALRVNPGYVHGDLGGDNLFVLADGYRVIDWQRPRLGPTDLDLATLLESLGCDPLRHVDEDIVRMMYFLRINWLTQCAVRWFPQGAETYDRSIAQLATLIGAPKDQ